MTETPPHLVRHIVLASPDIDAISAQVQEFLRIPQGFRHDMGAILGFRNEMMMIGQTMFELVQPVRPDHRLHRWFNDHGGEGGYMIAFQTFDADAFRARVAREQVRLARDMLFRGQDLIQLDSRRFGTHLETFRYSRPDGWWGDPVGRDYGASEVAEDIVAADVAVEAPSEEIAQQVGRIFASRVTGSHVHFPGKVIRFHSASEGRAGLNALDFRALDRSAAGASVRICNMDFRLV